MFPMFLTLITYIFLAQLQLSNQKCMSMQQETSGFPLGCCDHNNLTKRDLIMGHSEPAPIINHGG
jgi:hypothetical protein